MPPRPLVTSAANPLFGLMLFRLFGSAANYYVPMIKLYMNNAFSCLYSTICTTYVISYNFVLSVEIRCVLTF